ncbi:serine/threonine-protein kinase VRK1 [Manduca sexta]|uniref:serine/threonine-protein kinase VRK1 n=1 Tax=Manduca sexta TaxID=7130 RepID=UPI00188F22F5|nr:serine/threonine-protein kinase VRK1 [Manduca sexta]
MAGRGKKAGGKKKANGYKMPAPIPVGEVINDTLMNKKWKIGPSIGVGGFGEIYSASAGSPRKSANNYPYVVKIEPHENGPLFVEKHFYIKNANKDDISKFMQSKKLSSLGMPTYFGNGSHDFQGEKYRYLVLERYGKDVWTLFNECNRSFPTTTVFQLGLQMLDVLEYIHSRDYVHADIKGANILMGLKKGTENQAYLVDFGLASRVNDKEFKPDPKCAHNGTIEYTSRDAHLGVPTMRGDLEILGYNMLQWIVGELPWEKSLKEPKTVQSMKENFMKNPKANITKQYPDVPNALIQLFEYINTLKPKDIPDYTKCREIFESYLKSEGKTRQSKIEFINSKNTKPVKNTDKELEPKNSLKKVVVRRRGRLAKAQSPESDNCENEQPADIAETVKTKKRKSTEPHVNVTIKKTKMPPKATPPVKKNHKNTATQTSVEKPKRRVSFDLPEKDKDSSQEVNSSVDIFDDSQEIEEKKVKRRRRLLNTKIVTVNRVVRKKTTARNKTSDTPATANGRSPK